MKAGADGGLGVGRRLADRGDSVTQCNLLLALSGVVTGVAGGSHLLESWNPSGSGVRRENPYMHDPTVLAAIITAAGAITAALLGRRRRRGGDDQD